MRIFIPTMTMAILPADHHWRAVGPLLHYGGGEGLRGTLHEVDALHGLVLYRVLVKLMNLSSSKYLHTSAKVQKE